jgi:hypothetical protein
MTDPLELESAVKAFQAKLAATAAVATNRTADEHGLVNGLIKDFGLGGRPELRRACYQRLAHIEKQHGQTAEILIAEARSMAKMPGIRFPGNYFVRAVLLKLREAGLV